MRVLVKREDFSSRHYELRAGGCTLDFDGEIEPFSLPYREIDDFCVTRGKPEKTYFTMLSGGRMLEGQILDADAVEAFTAALREKLRGTIRIEVTR